jgi:hypothetical protein
MQKWWVVHEKKMPMKLSEEDKAAMEDTIGNLPILLNALLEIKLDYPADAEKQVENDVIMDEIYADQLTELHDKLWSSPAVKMMEATLLGFADAQSEKFRDSGKLLSYVYLYVIPPIEKLTLVLDTERLSLHA